MTVRDRAGDGLHRAPRELAHREREADRDDAEPCRRVEGRHEQAERLPRPHGDHEDRRGGQRDDPRAAAAVIDHLPSTRSGLPFSTIYVASSVPRPVPTFLAEWIAPAGMNSTSPAFRTTGGLPSSVYSHVPSRT